MDCLAVNGQHSNVVEAGKIEAVRCNERMRMVTMPEEGENECGGQMMRERSRQQKEMLCDLNPVNHDDVSLHI